MYPFDMTTHPCLFCDKDNPDANTVIAENKYAYARWDNFPVNPGHTEVIPIRHVESFFDLTQEELEAIYDLAKIAKQIINERYEPDAFNIGVNDGEAAGRTVHHLHIHLLPRYVGDVPNPRGGIRHIIPGRGDY
jgi:diadenosine tetraphosphate (Ap4A) HIT family hydrolase